MSRRTRTEGGCGCQAKWRQIGGSEGKTEALPESKRLRAEKPEKTAISSLGKDNNALTSVNHSSGLGERILALLEWGIKVGTFLTLPQLFGRREEDEKNDGNWEEFRDDLYFLLENAWPCSKNGRDPKNAGEVNSDERRHDQENPGGMCQSERDKKRGELELNLTRDKFLSQFFSKLLSAELLLQNQRGKPSVVRLIKLGLKSRYSWHLKESLKKRDLQSTLCILSIVGNNALECEPEEGERLMLWKDEEERKSETGADSNKSCRQFSGRNVARKKAAIHRVLNYLWMNPSLLEKEEDDAPVSHGRGDVSFATKTNALKQGKFFHRVEELVKTLISGRDVILSKMQSPVKDLEHKEVSLNPSDLGYTGSIALLKYKDEGLADDIRHFEQLLAAKKAKDEEKKKEREAEMKKLEDELFIAQVQKEERSLHEVVKFSKMQSNQAATHHRKLVQVDKELDQVKSELNEANASLNESFANLKACRKAKESERQSAVRTYKKTMRKHELQYKEMCKRVEDNEVEVQHLNKFLSGMDDRYEEMKNMRRLQELLRNMQMAEEVKENWAARRIQAAWKRYKIKKLRKRRFKKGRKKKNKEGDDKEETGRRNVRLCQALKDINFDNPVPKKHSCINVKPISKK